MFGLRTSQGCVDGEVRVNENSRENDVEDCE